MRRVVIIIVCSLATTPTYSQWKPTGRLANVPVIENCAATGGDIAVANPRPAIIYCQAAANALNARWPGAGHFYYVHEFGHLALGTDDEARADCWAAQQLKKAPNGERFLQVAIQHFTDRRNEPVNPRYGPMLERARRVARCGGIGDSAPPTSTTPMGRSCCTSYGKCGPFYNQPALPLGAVCNCGPGAAGRVCN